MAMKDILLTAEMISDIATDLAIAKGPVENTLKLILDDCTVPFIARYRKEVTSGLDEVQIRDIRDKFEYLYALNERREAILKSIEEQQKLTPELKKRIVACKVKSDLEDLYLPYKPKKRSRGQIARERGLEPLALEIYQQNANLDDLVALCTPYVGAHDEVTTLEGALQGARDYIAELISEIAEIRGEIRQWTLENALFTAEAREEYKTQKTKYNNYFAFSEPAKSIAAHRLMALRRGEKENILKVALQFDESFPLAMIERQVLKNSAAEPVKLFMKDCIRDAYSRIIATSIETELRLETKNRAEEEAMSVFSKNLRNLLLLPPIPKKVVLGVDPGLRTGSKLVVVDQTGKLLEHTTIFPDHDTAFNAPRNKTSSDKVVEFIKKHNVDYVSIGNGTAGREMDTFIESIIKEQKDLKVRIVVVNEAGASVYSASDVAREEFPDLDLTYRGAVSIARRLQDPLAELVKIDPKSIGVGQYQHDVNQSKLKKSLEEVVESCVNYVGVNLNTASPSLLSYVAGIGPTLAKNIVRHREAQGEFKDRNKLFEVMGFGPKAFEQSAGFLRIPESENPLDNTSVHPEAYRTVEKISADLSLPIKDLLGKKDLLQGLKLEKYVTEELGLPSLQDIIKELLKPGRDPREDGAKHVFNREVKDFNALVEGQILMGTVTNVTNFGAFVDIGVHQDGLIHISELSSQFVKDAGLAIAVGQQVKVKVIGVDKERKRISLSRRAVEENSAGASGAAPGASTGGIVQKREGATGPRNAQGPRPSGPGAQGQRNAGPRDSGIRPAGNQGGDRRPGGSSGGPVASVGGDSHKGREKIQAKEPSAPASMSDLLSKFNTRRV